MASKLAIAVLALVAVVMLTAPSAVTGITCGEVVGKIGPCVSYLTNRGPLVPACCGGVRSLSAAATTTPVRRTICGCLKAAAAAQRVNPGLAGGLPGKCGVNIGYPISTNVDCSRVQ